MSLVFKIIVKQAGKQISDFSLSERNIVTCGSGADNVISLPDSGLPESFPLIDFEGNNIFLNIPETVGGTISSKEGQASIADLKARGVLANRGDLLRQGITFNNSGNLSIGDYQIQFGFVKAAVTDNKQAQPTAAATAATVAAVPTGATGRLSSAGQSPEIDFMTAFDLRKERNWYFIFTFSITIHLIAAILMSIWDIPEIALELDKIPDRFARLIVDKPLPKEEPQVKKKKTATLAVAKGAAEEEAPPTETSSAKKGAGADEVGAVQRRENLRKQVAGKGILGIIGRKSSSSGAIADILSRGSLGGDLDEAISGIGGVRTAKTTTEVRETRGGGTADTVGIGDLKAGRGGTVGGLGGKKARKVSSRMKLGHANVTGKLDAKVIADVVRRNLRGIKYCYERELNNNPNLQGKVVVLFTIGSDGKVSNYQVESSTLNSSAVETCILRMIRRWRFPAPDGGSVTVAYPFVFSSAG
jgi:TonB family protein